MAFILPPAGNRYDRRNENEARRIVEQAFAELSTRLEAVEAIIAAGGVTPDPDPVGPTAGFTFSVQNLVVSFTDASTPGDAAITARLWTFGDGTTSTAPNNLTPVHTYPDAGTYQVTLKCTDANGLEHTSAPQSVTVNEEFGTAPIINLARGPNTQADIAPYTFFNGAQIGGLNPANCVTTIDGFANSGQKVALRLYRDADCKDANGVFIVSGWKASVRRYFDAGLAPYLNGRADDGTIVYSDIIDDIKAGHRWGRVITEAEIDEMSAFHRSLYPNIQAWVRARTIQIGAFPFQHLQGCSSIYLFNRGGVPEQGRIADCTAYRDQEIANRPLVNGQPIVLSFGINITNGGDGTSGQVGENPGSNANWRMSAQELRDYADILVPGTPASTVQRVFQQWEYNDGAGMAAYLADPAIVASQQYIRSLCDAQ
jgi:PKD repeat protein